MLPMSLQPQYQYRTEHKSLAHAFSYIIAWGIGCLVGLPIIIWRGRLRGVRPLAGCFCGAMIILGAVGLAYRLDLGGYEAVAFATAGMLIGLSYYAWANWSDVQATAAYHSRRADEYRRRQAG